MDPLTIKKHHVKKVTKHPLFVPSIRTFDPPCKQKHLVRLRNTHERVLRVTNWNSLLGYIRIEEDVDGKVSSFLPSHLFQPKFPPNMVQPTVFQNLLCSLKNPSFLFYIFPS